MQQNNDDLNSNNSEENENSNSNEQNPENKANDQPEEDGGLDTHDHEEHYQKEKEELQKDASNLYLRMSSFLKLILSLKPGEVDKDQMLLDIRKDMQFRGVNVWVLIFSIWIASIGLNTDSTAVIIGAMLISPLMGPIRGIGTGIATYDAQLIKDALKNFGVMVGIALATSTVYFYFTPLELDLSSGTNEILARTRPTVYDALIAFFGGMAGVIASTKGRYYTVISGVAIATALMPPLCVAGYGIGTGEWKYFAGAIYLFLLNSYFIALSSLIVLQYLKFPKKAVKGQEFTKKSRRFVTLVSIVITLPSAWLFYTAVMESRWKKRANEFVIEEIKEPNPMFTFTSNIEYNNISDNTIELSFDSDIPDAVVRQWKGRMQSYQLDSSILKVSKPDYERRLDELTAQQKKSGQGSAELQRALLTKDKEIALLRAEVEAYKEQSNLLESKKINAGFFVRQMENFNYDIASLSVGRVSRWNEEATDQIIVAVVEWSGAYSDSLITERNERLQHAIEIVINDQYKEDLEVIVKQQ